MSRAPLVDDDPMVSSSSKPAYAGKASISLLLTATTRDVVSAARDVLIVDISKPHGRGAAAASTTVSRKRR